MKVQEQEKNGKRVRVDVSIDAPLVVIPVKSDSRHSVMAYLGKIDISNSFSLVPVTGENMSMKSAVTDKLVVKLSNMSVAR